MRAVHFLTWSLVLLAACGDSPPPPMIPQDLTSCDITTAGCQLGIFESVARQLEQDARELPPIRTISVAQFEEEVRDGVSPDDLVGDDPESRGLRLIGFIPDTASSATEAEIDRQLTSVAAYYSSNSRAITIIDRDYEDGNAQSILAHEFVHALQDREFGIRTVFAGVDSTDGVMGARVVIEGDATYAASAWFVDQVGQSVSGVDWDVSYDDFQQFAKDDAADIETSIDASASFFPYAFGYEMLGRATQGGGLQGRAELFIAPPSSARDAMAGYDAFVANGFASVDEPAAVLPEVPDGGALALEDRSGAWYVYATLLRSGVDEEDAWANALAWRGDRLGIFESGSEVVAVWRIRFAADASFMEEAIAQSPRDVFWSAVVDGEDSFVIAAESDAALATWEAQPAEVVSAMVDTVPNARKSAELKLPFGCTPPPPPAF
ncbi:MAG: hypothetical protein AAF436_12330 [Myxococcota bacterium]